MHTRAEIQDTLAASQTALLAFFQGLSPADLERPATVNALPGAAPWRAKDHLSHLVRNERSIQRLLGRILAGEPPDAILLSQYPKGMPLPSVLGDLDALTPEEGERLELAIAQINQTYLEAHHDDTLEQLVTEHRAARQDTLDLLARFSDAQLAATVPSVVGEATASDLFFGRAGHAADHMREVEEGWRQGM